jgi:hypothetical protein
VYRKADVERVLHLKRLILVEGLTLAGVRRRLAEEADAAAGESELTLPDTAVGAAPGSDRGLDEGARASLTEVKRGLHWILETLGGTPAAGFALSADPEPVRAGKSKAKKK